MRDKKVFVIADNNMYLSKHKRVHVTSVSQVFSKYVRRSILQRSIVLSCKTLSYGYQSVGPLVISNQAHSTCKKHFH